MTLNHSTRRGNLIGSAPVDLSLPGRKRFDQNQIFISRNFEKILFPMPKKRKSLWLFVGRSRRGPEGARRAPEGSPEAPAHKQSETSTFFGHLRKKKIKTFKPRTKVIFYLKLSPLQHIKKWALYLKRLRRYGHLKLGIKIWKLTIFGEKLVL